MQSKEQEVLKMASAILTAFFILKKLQTNMF